MGKRPYKCGHEGCLKSFCRKSTLLKHHQWSHQHGILSSEFDDCFSKSEGTKSFLMPRMSVVPWLQAVGMVGGHPDILARGLHRDVSYADYSHHLQDQIMQKQCKNSYSTPMGTSHEYYGQSAQEQKHLGAHMLPQTASIPQHLYYTMVHSNPGEATMNRNQMLSYQVPWQ